MVLHRWGAVHAMATRILVAAACVFALGAGPSGASAVPSILVAQAAPGGTTPGAIREEFRDKPRPKPERRDTPATSQDEGEVIPCGPDIRLRLKTTRVKGSETLPGVETEPLLAPLRALEGQMVSCETLFAAAGRVTDALQKAYATAGYPLVLAFIPVSVLEQDGAELVIEVIEGFVQEVTVDGDAAGQTDLLRALGDRIKASRPLRNADLERYLWLANDLPGRIVKGTFSRIEDDAPAGATRLTLSVTHDPVAATLAVNNHGSRAVGPYRAIGSVTFNNLLMADERLRLVHARTLDADELDYGSVSLSRVFGSEGLVLEATGTWSNSIPGYETITPIGIGSDGITGSLRATYPVVRSRLLNLAAGLVLEGTRLETTNSLSPGTLASEEARIVRLEAELGWADPWGGFLSATLTQSQGLDLLGASLAETVLSGTNGARIDFSRSVLRLERTQPLLDMARLELALSGQGQYAGTRLINSELCGFGGRGFGRGYDNFEVSGDHCVMGAAELRSTPDLGLAWLSASVYGFADAGYLWRIGNPDLNTRRSSAGLGLRLQTESLRANIEYAKPLEGVVSQEGDADGRVFFELGTRF